MVTPRRPRIPDELGEDQEADEGEEIAWADGVGEDRAGGGTEGSLRSQGTCSNAPGQCASRKQYDPGEDWLSDSALMRNADCQNWTSTSEFPGMPGPVASLGSSAAPQLPTSFNAPQPTIPGLLESVATQVYSPNPASL